MKFVVEFNIPDPEFNERGIEYDINDTLVKVGNQILGYSFQDFIDGTKTQSILDINGNRIGSWKVIKSD